MISQFKIRRVAPALLFAAKLASGLPWLAYRAATTCPPSYITTLASTVTAPHSCYTYTVATANTAYPCVFHNPATCGLVPECIMLYTTTITVPASDPCCPTTTTKSIPGACASCQTGCAISTETHTWTEPSQSVPSATLARKDRSIALSVAPLTVPTKLATAAPCITTMYVSAKALNTGSITTVYERTTTVTSSVKCGGCSLFTRYLGGLGPEIIFPVTTTISKASTSTSYVCSASRR